MDLLALSIYISSSEGTIKNFVLSEFALILYLLRVEGLKLLYCSHASSGDILLSVIHLRNVVFTLIQTVCNHPFKLIFILIFLEGGQGLCIKIDTVSILLLSHKCIRFSMERFVQVKIKIDRGLREDTHRTQDV